MVDMANGLEKDIQMEMDKMNEEETKPSRFQNVDILPQPLLTRNHSEHPRSRRWGGRAGKVLVVAQGKNF